MQFSDMNATLHTKAFNSILVGLGLFVGPVPVAVPLSHIELEIPEIEMMDVDTVYHDWKQPVQPRRLRTKNVDILRPRIQVRLAASEKAKRHHSARLRLDKQRPKTKAKNAPPPANENHNPYKIRLGTRTGLKNNFTRMLAKSMYMRKFSVTAPVEWKPSDDVYEGDAPSSPMAVDDIYYRLPKMPNLYIDPPTPAAPSPASFHFDPEATPKPNAYGAATLEAITAHKQLRETTEAARRRERLLKVRKVHKLKRKVFGRRGNSPDFEASRELATLDDEPMTKRVCVKGVQSKVEEVVDVKPVEEVIENHLEMIELHQQLLEALWNDTDQSQIAELVEENRQSAMEGVDKNTPSEESLWADIEAFFEIDNLFKAAGIEIVENTMVDEAAIEEGYGREWSDEQLDFGY